MRLIFIFICSLIISVASAQVVINEYSAANYDNFQDNYGQYEDWFELYNPSPSDIDLNGYYLSDKEDNLTKWQFTSSVTLAANSYLVIYCSGRDEIAGTNVHTSFKLHQTKGNEWVILTDPDGLTVLDSVFVRPCLTNSSRGRTTDANTNWGIFENPTPNGNNTNAFVDYAVSPSFNPMPGIHAAPVNVTLTADPTSTIYYTTDGSLPDNTDNLYTGPILIDNTTVLKAVAYSNDPSILPSFMEYGTYFINVSHSLKILSVSGRESSNANDPELFELIAGGQQIDPRGTFELYESDGTLVDKAKGEFNKHGNDSWAYAQRGFDYITRDQFGYNYAVKGDLFNDVDRDKFQRLIVKCAANDNYPFSYGNSGAHIRDAYVQSLSQVADLRLDERSYEPCVMYLNGQYWGVYELREKVDDIDFTDHYYDQDSVEFLKTWGGTWVDVLVDGQNAADVENSWDNMRTYITSNDMTDPASYNLVKSQFNTGSLIDYFILNSYIVNADWLNWNTAWWHGLKEDGDKKKWRYILWDMDNTFDHGANYTGMPNTDTDANPCDAENLGNIGGQGHIPIWNALIQNDDFFDDYINRWSNLSNSYLSCDFMIQHLDSLINTIEPEMQSQIDRWGGTYAEWTANVQQMRDFMLERCNVLNSAIVDCYDVEGPYNVTVVIEGMGEVDVNNFFEVDELNTPFNTSYFGGVNVNFEVIDGDFSNFEIISDSNYNYDPNDQDFDIQLISDITIVFYFTTNQITYIVQPPGSGSMSVQGTAITAFPHTEDYLDSLNIALTANPNPGWEMGYWESSNHIFSPSISNQNVDFIATSDDTIVLNLSQQSFDITFVTEPANAIASLDINGQEVTSFPYTQNDLYGSTINLQLSTNVLWDFLYYQSTNGSIANASSSIYQSFQVDRADTIVLHFEPATFYPISFNISPKNTGIIRVNDSITVTELLTKEFKDGSQISFNAEANQGWEFSHWSVTNNQISPNETSVFANIQSKQSGEVVAHFEQLFYVYVPNAFSPGNDDQKHNTFDVSIYSGVEFEFSITIYNRFGERIFYSQDHTNSWDGTYKNKAAPDGIYTYILNAKPRNTNNTVFKSGTITLIR